MIVAIALMLVLVAGISITRSANSEQYATQYEAICGETKLWIVAPNTIPVRYDDHRTVADFSMPYFPLDIRLSRSNSPRELSLSILPDDATDIPIVLIDDSEVPLLEPITIAPDVIQQRLYISFLPTRRHLALQTVRIEMSVDEVSCYIPDEQRNFRLSNGSDEGDPLIVPIQIQGSIEGYFYSFISFFSSPEVWGSVVVGLVGGALAMQLRKREEIEEDKLRFQQTFEQIRRDWNSENYSLALEKFRHLDSSTISNLGLSGDRDRLIDHIFSNESLKKALDKSDDYFSAGSELQARRLLTSLLAFESTWKEKEAESASMIEMAKAVIGDVPYDTALNSILELYDKNSFEFYELMIISLRNLWSKADSKEKMAIQASWFVKSQRRAILLDPRLTFILNEIKGSIAANINRVAPYVPPFLRTGGPYELYYRPAPVDAKSQSNDRRELGHLVDSYPKLVQQLQNRIPQLFSVAHPLDAIYLQHGLWRIKGIWPVAVPILPKGPELFTDELLCHMCKELSAAWLQVARGMPMLDLLVGKRSKLLGSFLLWATGGTKSALLDQLLRMESVITFGTRNKESQIVRIDEEIAVHLIERLYQESRYEFSQIENVPSRYLLLQWLYLTPPGFQRNLFILIDKEEVHLKEKNGFCSINEDVFSQRDYNGPLFNLVTMRPDFFNARNRFVEVFWDTVDIEKAINSVRESNYFFKSALDPIATDIWKNSNNVSVERRIAENASGSLGFAIEVADRLDALHQEKGGGKALSLEDLYNVIMGDQDE